MIPKETCESADSATVNACEFNRTLDDVFNHKLVHNTDMKGLLEGGCHESTC